MMSLTFGLFTQVSGSGPLGPLVWIIVGHGPSALAVGVGVWTFFPLSIIFLLFLLLSRRP